MCSKQDVLQGIKVDHCACSKNKYEYAILPPDELLFKDCALKRKG